MNKVIYRNIAIVSAIFIVAFSIMLITNYFQVRDATPLQTEVVETLKQLNDANANNTALQEQIRQLDLLSRKAYFVRFDHLMTGVYILLGMLAVFLVCARGYFAGHKDIPDKDIDPIDEWAIKTKARKYVVWGTSVSAAMALVFVVLSSGSLATGTSQKEKGESPVTEIAEFQTTEMPIEETATEEMAASETESTRQNGRRPTQVLF